MIENQRMKSIWLALMLLLAKCFESVPLKTVFDIYRPEERLVNYDQRGESESRLAEQVIKYLSGNQRNYGGYSHSDEREKLNYNGNERKESYDGLKQSYDGYERRDGVSGQGINYDRHQRRHSYDDDKETYDGYERRDGVYGQRINHSGNERNESFDNDKESYDEYERGDGINGQRINYDRYESRHSYDGDRESLGCRDHRNEDLEKRKIDINRRNELSDNDNLTKRMKKNGFLMLMVF